MDIVGPLPRTKSGNRFILVTCDYGTRYPEAVPVKAIDAEHIAEELVRIFAHVGIQEKIMTNQGSNFTSLLLSEIYELLHVHPIRKTPYHSQIDCLVERFNKTLKAMLRKIAVADHLNWDGWVYTGKVLYGRYKEIARFSWFREKKNEAKSPPPLKSYFVYPLAMRLHVYCQLQKLGICLSDVATWSLIDKLGTIEVAKAIYVTQAKVAKAIEVAEANTIEEAIEATEAISI
ncbi:hypothetical protein EMCRGX_G026333 [Ephydatia muelleri]